MPPLDLRKIEIRTERLLPRRLRADDLDRPAAIQALPEVARYLYWEPATRDQVEPILARRAPPPAWRRTTTGWASPRRHDDRTPTSPTPLRSLSLWGSGPIG
jgi:RimJ/RimL family protein N-acetyltransferase